MRGARITALVLLSAALCALMPTALAHDERALSAMTVIDSVEPAIEGVEVRVVHLGAPALVVSNESPRTITVLGTDAEPFVRIGGDGVAVNFSSPTAYRSLDPTTDMVPPDVAATDAPRWTKVSEGSMWTWFDPRLAYGGSAKSWSLEMLVGDDPVRVSGAWEPLQGHGHFLTTIDAPVVKGLDLRLVEGPVPAIFARNDTSAVLTVSGAAGEPLLRIGPRGVWANVRSPSFFTAAAQVIKKVPTSADAAALPEWKKVSSQPVWAWLEYRAAVPAREQERDGLGSDQETVLSWSSPMALGGRDLSVSGRVRWIPPLPLAHHRPNPFLDNIGLVIAALVIAAGFVYSIRYRPTRGLA